MTALEPENLSVLLVVKGLDIGGIERIVVDTACAMARRGLHVEVAVVNERRRAMLPLLREVGTEVHELQGSDLLGWRALRRLWSLVASGRFDVVHVHGPLPSVAARLVRRSCVLVSTSHTPWTGLHRSTRMLWRATAWRDDVVTAVSAGVVDSLPVSARNRCVVVPHGVDSARIASAMAARPHGVHTPLAITVASHRDAKNYPNLLQALRVAHDLGSTVRLRCIGEGPGLETHRRLADELGVSHAVTFDPPLLDVLSEMAAADLLVVASDYEGQPLVVVEALALGLPVVATAVGRIPELVGQAQGVLVPPRDPQRLGAALAATASTAPGRPRAPLATRTIDEVVDDLLDLYRGAGGMAS